MISLILFILGVFNLPVFLASVSLSGVITPIVILRLNLLLRSKGFNSRVKINFNQNVVDIPDNEFKGDYIIKMKHTEKIERIGSASFYASHIVDGYVNLSHSTCKYIDARAFQNSNIESFEGSMLEYTILDRDVFYNCKSLKRINLNNSVLMKEDVFSGCTSLEDVDLGRNYMIPSRTFYGCSELKRIVIPNSVKYIGNEAFAATGITRMYIPEGVEEIGHECFYNTPLVEVFLPRTIKRIGRKAFPRKTKIIAYNSKVIFDYVKEYGNEYLYVLSDKNKYIQYLSCVDKHNRILDLRKPDLIDKYTLHTFKYTGYNFIHIPVTPTIEKHTYIYNLMEVVYIPEGTISIQDFAFDKNPIKDIFIPDSVKDIGILAFGTDVEITVHCKFDSYAEKWAKFTGREVEYIIKEEEFYAQFI